MAERVPEFPQNPGSRRYPWDEWLDGSPWLLRRGEDYAAKTASFRSMASRAAKSRGKRLRTTDMTNAHHEAIVIQAFG